MTYRIRFRFTKAKWPSQAFAKIMDKIAEAFPENEVLIQRAGRNIPILDVNVYVDQVDEEKLKKVDEEILIVMKEYGISHVVFKGSKVFEVERKEEEREEREEG